jgi:hypothetical protein
MVVLRESVKGSTLSFDGLDAQSSEKWVKAKRKKPDCFSE